MATTCNYCGKEIAFPANCGSCGKTIYGAMGRIICGRVAQEESRCNIVVTDKYLIIGSVSKAEARSGRMSGGLGLIGALVVEAAVETKKRSYGYYNLDQFVRLIFPYVGGGIKKKNAMKLITKDGKDLILICDQPGTWDSVGKALQKTVDALRSKIPNFEDGSKKNYGPYACLDPLVDLTNFDKVRLGVPEPEPEPKPKKPRAPRKPKAAPAPDPAPAPASATQPEPAPAPVPEPVSEPAPAPKAPPKPKAAPAPVEEPKPQPKAAVKVLVAKPKTKPAEEKTVTCPKCGEKLPAFCRFCTQCGSSTAKPEPRKCSACGKAVGEKDKFCPYCGTPAGK